MPGRISLKVLYTPDNNLTRSIMTKANRTFAAAEFLQNWAEQVSNCSEYFLESYPPDSLRVDRLRQVRRKCNVLSPPPPNNNCFAPPYPDN